MPVISIFERDASPSVREALGYSFSLREHSKGGSGGLQAIPFWMSAGHLLHMTVLKAERTGMLLFLEGEMHAGFNVVLKAHAESFMPAACTSEL